MAYCANVGSMFVQRLRRWTNIDPTLGGLEHLRCVDNRLIQF